MSLAVENILSIDKQMTELKRVMDSGTNFERMLKGSVELSKELGRNLTEVNEALVGFARQGFSESETLDLTRTAVLAQNISDLNAEESMDAITAAMVVFNIEASKSIEIINRINEIDNNFAVTSKNLALAMQKSSSAAQTFGVTLDEMLGDATAIMVSTRESGSVAGNALKTIYSRLTTMQPSIDALANIGVNIHNSNGELKTATQILDEVSVAFRTLDEETKQNTATTLAGRFQLSRFLALITNRQIAHEATTTAIHSENSAMRENAEYMKSFEARIEKMKVAWQQFALTIGDAVVNDAIVDLTASLTWFAGAFGSTVDTVGLLPPVLGLVGLASAGLSKNFRTLFISTVTLGNGMKSLGVSAKVAKASLRSLLASTGVGAAFVALGFILEGVIGHFADLKQAKEEQELQDNKSIDSMVNQSQKVEELTDKYIKLTNILSPTTEQTEELLSVKSELAELMPSFVAGITSEGEAHLKSADAIQLEIDRLKELQDRKDEVLLSDFGDKANKTIEDVIKNRIYMQDTQSLIDSGYYGDGRKRVEAENRIIDKDFDNRQYYIDLVEDVEAYNDVLLKNAGVLEHLTKADRENITEKIKSGLENVKQATTVEEATNAYLHLAEIINLSSSYLGKLRKEVGSAGDVFTFDELNLMSEETKNALKEISNLNLQGASAWEHNREKMISAGLTLDQVNRIINHASSEIQNFNPEVDELTEAIEDHSDAMDDTISSISSLASAYKTLQDGEELSLETTLDLISKYPQFASLLNSQSVLLKDKGALLEQIANFEREERLREAQRLLDSNKDTYESLESKRLMYKQFYEAMRATLPADQLESIGGQLFTEADKKLLEEREQLLARIQALSNPIKLKDWNTSVNKSSSKKEEDPREKLFNEQVAHFKYLVEMQDWTVEEQIAGWKRLQSRHSAYLKSSIEDERSVKLEIKKLQDQIAENEKESIQKRIDAHEEWKSNVESIADDVVDVYKDAIKSQIDAEEKRHQNVIDNLDDELKKYEEVVNGIIDTINRQNDTDDHNKEVKKAQDEILKLEKDKNALSLDDSVETQAKVIELENQLKEKREELAELQQNRERDIRKQSLQDLIDLKKKETEKAKEAANKTTETIKSSLENQLNNEEYFTKLREDILNGHLEGITKNLDSFSMDIQSKMSLIGDSISNNVLNKIKDVKNELGSINYNDTSSKPVLNNPNNLPTGNTDGRYYVPANEEERKEIGRMKSNSNNWKESTSPEAKKHFADANQDIGKKIGATYNSKEGRWYKNGLPLYHEGGEVGVQGTSFKNWMATKGDEIIAKLKLKEVVMDNPIQNMQDIASRMMGNINNVVPRTAMSGAGDTNYHLQLTIHGLNGDRNGGKTVFNEIVKGLQKMGK